MKINRNAFDAGRSNWVSGETEDHCTFYAKVFTSPSRFGVQTAKHEDGGNVSIITILDQAGETIYDYDRGSVSTTSPEGHEAMIEIVGVLEGLFCEDVEPLDNADAQWVRDVASKFGFVRNLVNPMAMGNDPWQFCRFEVMGITYEVDYHRLNIAKQER